MDNLRHDLSQSLAERTLYEHLFSTSRSGASGSSSEVHQLRQEHDTLVPVLEWMHMEETQPKSAAPGGGGTGTDVTTFIRRGGSEFVCSSG